MTRTNTRAAFAATVAAALIVGMVSGCASSTNSHGSASIKHSAGSTGSAVSHSTATPKSTPKPSGTPAPAPLAANVLFRITASATDLKSHAVVNLVETVYVPAPLTTGQNAQLVSVCGDSQYPSDYPDALGVTGTLSATLQPGSPAWTQYSPLGIGAFMSNDVAWTGTFAPSANLLGCATMPPIEIPSTATGIAPVSPASAPAGVAGGHGWYNGAYGWYITNDTNGAGPAGLIAITSCKLQLGAAAIAAAPAVAQWPSEPNPTDEGQACQYAPLD